MGIWYCTSEDVKSALDVVQTARNDRQIARAVEFGSRTAEGRLHRRFYPERATRRFDWPNYQRALPWRLWLESNEIISLETVVSGTTTIPTSAYFLRRSDDLDEPPYSLIELDLSQTSGWSVGGTHQRSIALTGLFGYADATDTAGTLAAAVSSASATTVDVTDSSVIGTGQLLKIESERLVVTGRSALTTGQTLQANLTATTAAAGVSVAVSSGTAFAVGEMILIDAERMLIVDIAGNNLIVRRAWDGSVLADHTAGATIYAPRRLTVQRGVLGSTAATHLISTAVARQVFPGPVVTLSIAEALTVLLQEGAGYARVAGSGDAMQEIFGRGLKDIRAEAEVAVGRQLRLAAI